MNDNEIICDNCESKNVILKEMELFQLVKGIAVTVKSKVNICKDCGAYLIPLNQMTKFEDEILKQYKNKVGFIFKLYKYSNLFFSFIWTTTAIFESLKNSWGWTIFFIIGAGFFFYNFLRFKEKLKELKDIKFKISMENKNERY